MCGGEHMDSLDTERGHSRVTVSKGHPSISYTHQVESWEGTESDKWRGTPCINTIIRHHIDTYRQFRI